MARRRRHRQQQQQRRNSAGRHGGPVILDALGAGVALLIIGLFRGIRWVFRKALGRPDRPPPEPAPPRYLDAGPTARPIPAIWRSGLSRPGAPVAPALADAVRPGEALPYRRQRRLLSKGEWAFWHPLYQAVKGKYRIFCKVRLADVICCQSGRRDERRWFRKIGSYHVDFVIADPETTAPLLVIELDDRGHGEGRQRERDRFKDEVLRVAGMPVYRVPSQQAYDVADLTREIQKRIDSASSRGRQ